MRNQLRKRLEALESCATAGTIFLTMPEGEVQEIDNRDPMDLLVKVLRSQVETSPEVRLLTEAVFVREPGGSHLAELARAIALSPVE